jgi:hypothetical protein
MVRLGAGLGLHTGTKRLVRSDYLSRQRPIEQPIELHHTSDDHVMITAALRLSIYTALYGFPWFAKDVPYMVESFKHEPLFRPTRLACIGHSSSTPKTDFRTTCSHSLSIHDSDDFELRPNVRYLRGVKYLCESAFAGQ